MGGKVTDVSEDTIPPEASLAAPARGEILSIGSNYDITWNSLDNVGITIVTLEYIIDDNLAAAVPVVTGISDEGFYTWTVPNIVSNKVQIRITVSDASGNTGFDITDYFSISDRTRPIVSVMSPNGGEVWATGDQQNVTWEAQDNVGISSINILYSIDEGLTWTLIADDQSNSGSYSWIVPDKPASTYKVKVIALDAENNQREDSSDSTFTVISANNLPNMPSSPFPEDEELNASVNVNLSWISGDPDMGDNVTYDVYFDTNSDPSLVISNYTGTTYEPGSLYYQRFYFWKIVANDSHGLSISSPVWSFLTKPKPTPIPPSTLKIVVGAEQIDLKWADNSNDESGFKIERKIGSGDSYSLIDVVTADTNSFSDINLTESGTCYYRVSAYNSTGSSIYSNEVNTVTSTSGGGEGGEGSGGGGGGVGSSGSNGKRTTSLRGISSQEGEVWENVKALSFDSKLWLDIPYGTIAKNRNGNALTAITVTTIAEPHAPQTGNKIIGGVYDIGPSGATFNPPITITFSYDPNNLPEGVNEQSLAIAWFDKNASEWKVIEDSVVDASNHTITAHVSHFTPYAIVHHQKPAPPAPTAPSPTPVPSMSTPPLPTATPTPAPSPASFIVADLSIAPNEARPAEEVTISALVTNTGGSEGSYTVVLKINGVEEAKKEVIIKADKSERVTFTVAKETLGSYTVDINGNVRQFSVVLLPPLPESTGALPFQPSTHWWLFGGIATGGVIIILLLAFLFVWRRRGA